MRVSQFSEVSSVHVIQYNASLFLGRECNVQRRENAFRQDSDTINQKVGQTKKLSGHAEVDPDTGKILPDGPFHLSLYLNNQITCNSVKLHEGNWTHMMSHVNIESSVMWRLGSAIHETPCWPNQQFVAFKMTSKMFKCSWGVWNWCGCFKRSVSQASLPRRW